jgi:predicted amidohydrolase
MRVAAVQFEPVRGDVARNRQVLTALVDEAASGSDLVVCPEMAPSGYLFPDVDAARAVAEPENGPTFAALSPIALRRRALVVCGFAEAAPDGTLFNSAMLVAPDGSLLAVYRKRLLYPPDARWAAPGDRPYLVVETPWGRLGVGVCMDLNDPRFVRYLAEHRVDVAAFPTNWVESDDIDVHDYWQERLEGTRTTLVAGNRWGQEDDVVFSGRSAILTQDTLVAAAARVGDAVVRAVTRP